jgi:hypothetical protein
MKGENNNTKTFVLFQKHWDVIDFEDEMTFKGSHTGFHVCEQFE